MNDHDSMPRKDEEALKTIMSLFRSAERLNERGTWIPWYKRWWRQWRLNVHRKRLEKLL